MTHLTQLPDFRARAVGAEAGYALVGAKRPKMMHGGTRIKNIRCTVVMSPPISPISPAYPTYHTPIYLDSIRRHCSPFPHTPRVNPSHTHPRPLK